jgi:uncharacterized protein (TIGR03118 family)
MNIKNLLYRRSNVFAVVLALTPAAAVAQTTGNNAYVQHNLVSDVAGKADLTDPNLVNPWGMSQSATSPWWASNHDKGNSTLYNGTGIANALVVIVPQAGTTSTPGTPTGQVVGNGASWKLNNGAASSFIFATEDGTISAWNGGLGTAAGVAAEIKVDNSKSGAVYKGLASNPSTTSPMLYAANFNSGKIDVFDGSFAPITVSGGFTDPNLPAGFAPFNIWNVGGKLYVTYAKQDANKKNDVAGAGNGVVDIFDFNGNMLQHVATGGPLNSPWGVAVAPANWGAFGGDILVGNFGDGKINAFDPKSGNALGTLQDPTGNPIVIQGLWAIIFGNGSSADQNTLYFAAGPSFGDSKNHGLYGGIAPPAQVTSINNAASQASGAIAPGEIVELNGFTIGPSPRVAATIPATGTLGASVGTTASGVTSVTFNNIAAPILYASASATSVIVPYGVAGSQNANVVVTYKNNATSSFSAQVAATAPGLFTLNQTGSGAVVAYNSDNTLNSSTNPAARGSAVLLYATGEGVTNPLPADGAITTGDFFHVPQVKVSLQVESKDAGVVYALSAPGTVAGVLMIEAVLPTNAGAAAGAVPIVLTIGSASSPAGTTIFVK